jgi:hypothetical protein
LGKHFHLTGALCNQLKNCRRSTLSDFDVVTTVTNDEWNGVKDGDVHNRFFTKTDPPKAMGSLNYRLHTGQIGWLNCYESFMNRGLEEQLLKKAEDDIRAYGTANTIWEAVVPKESPLYSNDTRFTWKDPAHNSVTGDGWSMDL